MTAFTVTGKLVFEFEPETARSESVGNTAPGGAAPGGFTAAAATEPGRARITGMRGSGRSFSASLARPGAAATTVTVTGRRGGGPAGPAVRAHGQAGRPAAGPGRPNIKRLCSMMTGESVLVLKATLESSQEMLQVTLLK